MRVTSYGSPRPSLSCGIRATTTLSYSNGNDLPYAPPPSSTSAAAPEKPGVKEDDTFTCTPSVKDWRDHDGGGWSDRLRTRLTTPGSVGPEFLRFLSFASSSIAKFALQGLASLALARLVIDGTNGSSSSFLTTMQSGFSNRSVALLGEAAHAALQEYEEIEKGRYKLPYDFDLRHPSQRLSSVARSAVPYFGEAISTLRRRSQSASGNEPEIANWLRGDTYPDYYANSFHYQSDGWMSSDSASIYETSTQTLFLGRQDFMQKTALSAISSFYDKKKSDGSTPEKKLRVLEIGAGTGRFSVYLRDSIETIAPTDSLDLTLVDLSPFYLQKARKNHNDYERFKRRTSSNIPGHRVTYVQGNGENLDSLASDDYDVVICMYTFHELPPSARANFAKTMSRLVKKGGLAVFTDSIQLGDRPLLDDSIGAFKAFNEPFYDTYIEEDVGALFQANGLEREEKWLSSVTKTLTFTKN